MLLLLVDVPDELESVEDETELELLVSEDEEDVLDSVG